MDITKSGKVVTEAEAHRLWLAGRYYIGCQALDVETDPHGYCAECVAGYDASFQALHEERVDMSQVNKPIPPKREQ